MDLKFFDVSQIDFNLHILSSGWNTNNFNSDDDFSSSQKYLQQQKINGIVFKDFVMISAFTTSETAVKPFAVTKWPCPRHNH